LLFAAMAVAVEHGLKNQKESLKFAEDLHVEGSFSEGGRELVLPKSCAEAAEGLEKDRQFFEADGVFPPSLMDKTISRLKGYGDRELWRKVIDTPEEVDGLLEEYFNYG